MSCIVLFHRQSVADQLDNANLCVVQIEAGLERYDALARVLERSLQMAVLHLGGGQLCVQLLLRAVRLLQMGSELCGQSGNAFLKLVHRDLEWNVIDYTTHEIYYITNVIDYATKNIMVSAKVYEYAYTYLSIMITFVCNHGYNNDYIYEYSL